MNQDIRLFGWLSLSFILSSCTAWNYEAEPCDPSVKSLSRDSCKRLNSNLSDCMVYQCDGKTLTCKLGLRDYDRDGDPDSICGGTDCNDYDPNVYGREVGQCECKRDLVDTDCFVGVNGSVCERKAKYTCPGGTSLVCPASPGSPNLNWQTQPDPMTASWDWNCDGTVQFACKYDITVFGKQPTTVTDENCIIPLCSSQVKSYLLSGQTSNACDAYCNELPESSCRSDRDKLIFLSCDKECGAAAVSCKCYWSTYDSPERCVREGFGAKNALIICK